MRLSAIEIFGFKSFPHRTRIDFGPGIAAVVGPNGCGKSNIADAFRWALGEQSAKSLRGDVMEDLIFNGTADTPPLSLAEVSLYFDEVGGHLPLDADEVVVTRRMYRQGESHCFLNGKPVRLKDIRELFADTGLGRTSYAVMEQGMVEAIIRAKADERRALFEEAAGIRNYRAKRAEATRKLADVQLNVERLEDLLSEYRRQARALKRQAGAARRHHGLLHRLRELDLGLAKLKYTAGGEKKKAAVARRDEFAAAYRGAKSRAANASAELARLGAEGAAAELELEQKEKALLARQRELKEAEAAHQLAVERHRSVTENIARLRAERGRLADELVHAEQEERKLAGDKEEYARRITEAESRAARGREELATALEREAALAREVEDARAEQLRRFEKRTRLANLHATAAAARESLARELARMRGEAQQASLLFDERLASQEKAGEELSSLRSELAQSRAAAEELTASDQRLTAALAAAEAAAAEAAARYESVRSRLSSLQELARRFESFGAGVAALMERGTPAGIAGLLVDALKVREGYEAALEAALGPAAGALLAADLATAAAYGQRLATTAKGRAAFLVPGAARAAERDLPVVEGVRGWASGFVAAGGPFGDAVSRLLDNVIVVEDLAALRAIAELYPAVAAVTLNGDRWDGRAVLVAGAAENASATILGRRAEMAKLATSLQELTAEVKRKKAEVARLRIAREELARRKDENAARITKVAAACANLQAALARDARDASSQAERRTVLEREIAGAEDRLGDAFRQEENLAGQLAASGAACEESGQLVTSLEEGRREARARVDELRREVAEIRAQAASFHERLNAVTRDRQRLADFREKATNEQARRAESIAQKEGEENELRAGIAAWERAVAEKQAAFAAADDDVKDARSAQNELGGRRREAEQDRAAAEKAMEEVADSLRDQDLAVAEVTSELNALDESFAVKYNVRLSTLAADQYVLEGDAATAEEERAALERRLGKMGEVNFRAAREYEEIAATLASLEEQRADLAAARANLDESIARIDAQSRRDFVATFERVREEFHRTFQEAFGGGQADINLQPGVDPLEAGIYIYAQPPGKKMEHLSLLSGGEKALTAIALIFALFNVRPAPFAIMDEVDAPLDENNIERFLGLLNRYRDRAQFMLISHARRTMEAADAIYGITMERKGISKVLSLKLEEIPAEYLEPAAAAAG